MQQGVLQLSMSFEFVPWNISCSESVSLGCYQIDNLGNDLICLQYVLMTLVINEAKIRTQDLPDTAQAK